MDFNCSPPATSWHVSLASADGLIRQALPIMHLPHEGSHMVTALAGPRNQHGPSWPHLAEVLSETGSSHTEDGKAGIGDFLHPSLAL